MTVVGGRIPPARRGFLAVENRSYSPRIVPVPSRPRLGTSLILVLVLVVGIVLVIGASSMVRMVPNPPNIGTVTSLILTRSTR